jgi:hypothetical protein
VTAMTATSPIERTTPAMPQTMPAFACPVFV